MYRDFSVNEGYEIADSAISAESFNSDFTDNRERLCGHVPQSCKLLSGCISRAEGWRKGPVLSHVGSDVTGGFDQEHKCYGCARCIC